MNHDLYKYFWCLKLTKVHPFHSINHMFIIVLRKLYFESELDIKNNDAKGVPVP